MWCDFLKEAFSRVEFVGGMWLICLVVCGVLVTCFAVCVGLVDLRFLVCVHYIRYSQLLD